MPKLSQEKLKSIYRILESTTVFTVDQLVSLLRCSKPTARLRLKQWKTHTSYNQNGRYYAMPTVPHCRLLGYLTHLIFNYFTDKSCSVFRSERGPIGLRNGTIRSNYLPSRKHYSKSVNHIMSVMGLFMTG